MDSLQSLHLIDVIKQRIHQKKPLLSICIGLQILFSQTEEGDCHKCLGIFPGDVKKLPPALKIPHIGWNQVKQTISHSVFEGIPDNTNFYFVHSYYAEPQDASIIAGTTDYGKTFCSMIIKDNLLATQFHPERSGEYGLRIYANFLNRAMDGE
jgi:glutamine amidotransferase